MKEKDIGLGAAMGYEMDAKTARRERRQRIRDDLAKAILLEMIPRGDGFRYSDDGTMNQHREWARSAYDLADEMITAGGLL